MSFVGDMIGDSDCSSGFPSGIVFGGETVILLVKLPVLFSKALVSVGETGGVTPLSLTGDIVDADVRDAAGRAGGTLGFAVASDGRISIAVAEGASDGFS